MRTLKKVLALSLVCAMAFTMMAGATFKDQDKINSDLTNDVELMQALNVLKGDENGNLNPTDTVTREQAAKMIYVLKNGGTDDGATGWKGMNLFSDVQSGRWSEGYINYCASIGIINGWMENGKSVFAPTSPVTGVELGKMLLTLVGYKASEQGYTGASWQANVLADGQEAGIFTSFTPSVLAPTPREWTARLMVNALNAYSITYSKGELVVSNLTYAQKNLKLYSVEGQLTETNINKLGGSNVNATLKSKDDNQIAIKAITGLTNTVTASIAYDDAKAATPLANLLGEKVKVFYKMGTDDKVDNAAKIYSVIAAKNVVVKTLPVNAITVSGSDSTLAIAFDGYAKTVYGAKTLESYTNNVKAGADITVEAFKMKDNRNVTLIDNNGDGYFEIAKFDAKPIYAIVDTNDSATSTFTVKNATSTFKLDNGAGTGIDFNKSNATNYTKYLNFVDTVAKDDVVAITENTTSGKLVYDVKLATKVAEAATGYTLSVVEGNTYFDTVKVGTTNYNLSSNAMTGYNWNKTSGSNAGSDKTFYTDGKYVVFSKGADTSVNVDNLVYVIGKDSTTSYGTTTYKVKVLHADGTIAEYVLNESTSAGGLKNDAVALNANLATQPVFSYSLTDNNTKIVLKALPAGASGSLTYVNKEGVVADGSYVSKTGVATIGGSAYKVAADAVFFAKSGTTYKIVKGSELADLQAIDGNQYASKSINGFSTLVFGVLNDIASVTSDKANAFVTGSPSYIGKVGDKYVVTLPVWANGKADTLSFSYGTPESADADMTSTLAGLKNKAIEYTVTDGYATANVITATAAASDTNYATNYAAGKVWYTGNLTAVNSTDAFMNGQFMKVASDVKVTVVDENSGSYKVVEGGSIVKSDGAANSVLVKVSVSNGVVTIKEIICEADGAAMNIATVA
ncbi:S-layer homology domain-containing protein [Acidaminobacterium chupaoyuni]